MQRIHLTTDLSLSPVAWGFWRLIDWNISSKQLLQQLETALDMGVSTMDHADIYGDYSCEAAFGTLLKQQPSLRNRMELVSKCGIQLRSEKYPHRKVKQYDTSKAYIIAAAEQSLRELQTDYLDVLLLHRPDPLLNGEEVAAAFQQLKESGKVRYFGVSNFSPSQQRMLQSFLPESLVTNQVEFSPYHTQPLTDGTFDYLQEQHIHPMIWSPLAGGKLFHPQSDKSMRLKTVLLELSNELGKVAIETLMYAWIMKHPSRPIPIVGSGQPDRLKRAVEALSFDLPREAWFRIYEASRGKEVD